MANIYSVKEINRYLSQMFDTDFLLRNLCVKGEVSNCKYQSNGTIYFKLKDQGSLLNCMMWASNRSKGLSFVLQDGMQVQVSGYVKLYEAGGYHQLYATKIEQAGQGTLYLQFLQMKQELEEMGLFAPEYKKPIPRNGRRIGVVTAETGAVIHDIEITARRRNPYVELILYPAKVQGVGAAETIVAGIEYLDRLGLDAIIVGRGGGSIEDLWAFNERIVAEAVFNAETPIISAVGHETDVTICDFAADCRVATPTAAAELAVASLEEWLDVCDQYREHMYQLMQLRIHDDRRRIESSKSRLHRCNPEVRLARLEHDITKRRDSLDRLLTNRLAEEEDELNGRKLRMDRTMDTRMQKDRQRLLVLAERLEGNSPLKRLRAGFGYVGISSVDQVNTGDRLEIAVSDGFIETEITGKRRKDE